MYKQLLALLLALSAFISLSGQNFFFPDSNAYWISCQAFGCIGGSTTYDMWKDYIGGDTVIQSKTYKRLYHRATCTVTTAGIHCPYTYIAHHNPAVAIGALRVEGAKVYFIKFNSAQGYSPHLATTPVDIEILLYDFNWKVNDTINIPTLDQTPHGYRVEEITTMSNGRKQFRLNPTVGFYYPQSIWEGAGNTMGLFAHLSQSFINNYPTCFTMNGESIMYTSECDYCVQEVGTEEPLSGQLSVFPNPASDELTVQFSGGNSNGKYRLKLFDLQGRLLMEQPDFVPGSTLPVGQWAALRSVLLVLQDLASGHGASQLVQLN